MPSFDIDPCAQLAMKSCLVATACILDGDPGFSIQAQANFAASASKKFNASIQTQNACFMAALALAFAAAGQPMPVIAPLPVPPDITSLIPTIPVIPPIPVITGVSITFAEDGITPTRISF